MNKKLIKSITSKILWVALITLIIACEKDNMSETQVNVALENELQQIEPEITTQQLRFNDFPHKMQVKSYLHQIKENTTSTVLEHVSNSNTDDDFNPLTGLNIIQNQAEYTTYEGGHTYTFATYRNNDNGLIENIVLESQTDGSYNEYLMQYQLTDIEFQSLQEHSAYGFNLLDRTTLIPLENGSFNALVTNSVNCEKEAYTYSSTIIIGFCPCPEHQASHQDGTCICEFAPRATVEYIGFRTKCSGGGGTTTVIGDNPSDGTDPGDFSSGGTTDVNNPNSGINNENGNTDNSGTDDAVDEIGGATKPFEVLDANSIIEDCIDSTLGLEHLSTAQKADIANFINTNGCSVETTNHVNMTINAFIAQDNWNLDPGTFPNRPALTYTHTFVPKIGEKMYLLENGLVLYESSVERVINKPFEDTIASTEVATDGHHYIHDYETGKWYEYRLPPPDYQDTDLTFLFNAFWNGPAKFVGRYVLPLEDAIILIDGKDFDGIEQDRVQTAGFMIVGFIPGGKAFKPVTKIVSGITRYRKIVKVTVNGVEKSISLPIKIVNGVVEFGSSGSKLRTVLNITDSDFQAHHIIPWAKRTHQAVQKAAKSSKAFHPNEALNGIPLHTDFHSGYHPNFSNQVQARLDNIDINQTADDVYDEILDIISDVRNAIESNPTTHINQLVF